MKHHSTLAPGSATSARDDFSKLWPLAKGSLAEIRKPCIRPSCPACARGCKHSAFIYSYRRDGKTHCRYVPRALAPDLRQAISNWRKLEALATQWGERLLTTYRQQQQDKRTARPSSKKNRL